MSTEQDKIKQLEEALEDANAMLEVEKANHEIAMSEAQSEIATLTMKLEQAEAVQATFAARLAEIEAMLKTSNIEPSVPKVDAEIAHYRLLAEAKTAECIAAQAIAKKLDDILTAAAQVTPETAQIQADAEKHRLDMEAREANAQRVEAERQRVWEAEQAEQQSIWDAEQAERKAEVDLKAAQQKAEADHTLRKDIADIIYWTGMASTMFMIWFSITSK